MAARLLRGRPHQHVDGLLASLANKDELGWIGAQGDQLECILLP